LFFANLQVEKLTNNRGEIFMKNKSQTGALSISGLRASFNGNVIAPGDEAYDAARTTFYGGIDHRPAVIIRARNADEVARVIELARQTGLELAVRSGGHSMVGHSVSDGGIVLDLSLMRDLQIAVEEKTAWVEPGMTAGEYTNAVGAYGLATGFGDTGSVGIGGLTLGGGVGYLVRKHGLTIDSLLAAQVVTADGQLLHVDADSHPDLFWAIRGGGGNFGVVTRFKFRLHEVDAIVGGMLFLPATAGNLASFISLAGSAPEEFSAIANVMTAPPMPFIPEAYYGKPVIMAILVYAGDPAEGQRVVAPFKAIDTPLADMVQPMKYPQIYQTDAEDYHPVAAARTMFMDSIDGSAAQRMLDHITASTASMAVTQLRVLGGAMARVPADATAFAHRNSKIMVNVAALYDQPDQKAAHEAWVEDLAADLQQSDAGAYVNFLGNEGEARIRAAYPNGTWERLAAIKAQYDPTNLFRLNQNIPPAK
jgi:FAD/FMN-containing dehydrogenase